MMTKTQTAFRIGGTILSFVLIASIFVSIAISQVFAPTHFSSLGQQKNTLTSFLRASVKLGDSYLIKQVFRDSLVKEYPTVFNSYLQENEWLSRLKAIEVRAPESSDVLSAMSVIYDHMGDKSKAKIYRDKIKSIDPTY